MNQVSPGAVADTPASRLRSAIESTGYTITGLSDDATETQVLAIAKDLARQLDHFRSVSTPATAAARKALNAAADALGRGVVVNQSKIKTMADVDAVAVALGASI